MEMYDKDRHISQLEAVNEALMEKITFLTRRKMERNNLQSLKWRNSAFYYKKKCTFLEGCLEKSGISVPVYNQKGEAQ